LSQFFNDGRLRTAPLLLDLLVRDPASLAMLLRALHRKLPTLAPAAGGDTRPPAHLQRRFGRQPDAPPPTSINLAP